MAQASKVRVGDHVFERDRTPEVCPICKSVSRASEHTEAAVLIGKGSRQRLECLFQCARADCRRLFIARYEVHPLTNRCRLIDLTPCPS